MLPVALPSPQTSATCSALQLLTAVRDEATLHVRGVTDDGAPDDPLWEVARVQTCRTRSAGGEPGAALAPHSR